MGLSFDGMGRGEEEGREIEFCSSISVHFAVYRSGQRFEPVSTFESETLAVRVRGFVLRIHESKMAVHESF